MDNEKLTGEFLDSITAFLGQDSPENVCYAGNINLINKKKIGLLISVNCPGVMIFQSYDFVFKMRARLNISFVSGFHSPMERECLNTLSIGKCGIIYCIAKSLDSFKLPNTLKEVYDNGRLLIISPFSQKVNRINKETAIYRNKVVAALSDDAFFAFAEPNGKTEKLCQYTIQAGKSVFTLDAAENENIINFGATPIDVNNVLAYWPNEEIADAPDILK